MKYLAKFNNEGVRETSVVEDIHFETDEEKQKYLDAGYIEITEEEQALYASNEYIRGTDGKPHKKPTYVPTPEELKAQALATLDTEYDQQFDALTLAWATAFMSGDTQTAEARLADKQALQQEYETKKGAILNG